MILYLIMVRITICERCNRERTYYAKGKCRSCYGQTIRNKEKQKVYVQNWKNKRPDYFKQYYQKSKEKKKEVALLEVKQ